jgi:LmbE family N-acetylglucosaminyl deacetylase
MKALQILWLVLVACGDNELPNATPLATAHDLVIVAHQDDDLLFMQPDLIEAVRRGGGVTIVYVTAGNDNHTLAYSTKRYDGVMAAYAAATGATGWGCGWVELAGHAAEHCRLDDAKLSLVFLGYPDGGKQGELSSSLLALWEGRIAGADTIAERTAHYDREGLIATLAAIIHTTQPSTIRTLEVAATHGVDHSDHMLVGALAVLARASSPIELLSYRGYNINGEPIDAFAPVTPVANDAFAHYTACTEDCASCGEACTMFSATYAGYMQRRYAVRIGRRASGALVSDGACANADGTVTAANCAAPTLWHFDRDGALHVADQCITVQSTGELIAGSCDAATPVSLDEEGHIWIAVAPPPASGLDLTHLDCLAAVDGHVRAMLCGGDFAPAWTVAPATVTTPRIALGLAQTGRAVRLADLTGDGIADLCTIEATGLACAAGDGHGGFTTAVSIAALAVEPESLAIGDIDGDGRPDACGRDTAGILCATAASGFTAQRFTIAFAGASDPSLAILDGQICGLASDGVVCASPTVSVQSTWPARDAILWPADLDGDHLADWCVATPTGPACGLGADRALSTDGVPWAFSLGGVVDATSPDATTGGFADLDGDGRADFCAIDGTRVACAFSHGGGFGPRTTVMELASAPVALWLADGEVCVDTGSDVVCAH